MRRVGLLVLLFLASPSVSMARDPWTFANSDERARANDEYRETYYYIQYQKAERLLDKKGSADEAADRLKLAIATDPASGTKKLPGSQVLEYFPYFLLAKAFAEKGDFTAAESCLKKESNKIAQVRNYADEYRDFSRRLPQLAYKDQLLKHGRDVLAWKGGQGKVLLTPQGIERLSRVEPLYSRLQGLGPADGEAVGTVSDQLQQEIKDLTTSETQTLAVRLGKLGSDPWSGAFATDKSLINQSLCQATAGGINTDLGPGIDRLEKCSDAVIKATRIAGRWECASLNALRKSVSEESDNLKRWTQAQGGAAPESVTLAALPTTCIKWGGAAASEASAAFAALENEGPVARQALTRLQGTINATFAKNVEDLVARIGRYSSQLPDISNQCAKVLQLGQSASQVRSLRNKLSTSRLSPSEIPAPELFQAEKLVNAAMGDLVARVQSGAGQIEKSGECQGMKRDSFDALPNELKAYLDSRKPAGLGSLCSVAIRADADIQACWTGRIGDVQARVEGMDDMLNMTDAIPVTFDERLGCLERVRDGVQRVRNERIGDKVAWVQKARDQLSEAQVCLTDLSQITRESRAAMMARVSELQQMLEPLSGGSSALDSGEALPPGVERLIRSLLTEVGSMAVRLDALGPLYADTSKTGSADLKPVLEKTDLYAGLSQRAQAMLNGQGGDQSEAEADFMPVIRDSATLPWLQSVNQRLDDLHPTVTKLGPFAALSQAFAVFQQSDLDQSILVLREARRKGHLPEQGKAAALVHAAMAYFVYSKARAVTADGDVKRSLERDVQLEARMAKRADRSFSLPQDLFPNGAFRKTFEEYAAAETGQEG